MANVATLLLSAQDSGCALTRDEGLCSLAVHVLGLVTMVPPDVVEADQTGDAVVVLTNGYPVD